MVHMGRFNPYKQKIFFGFAVTFRNVKGAKTKMFFLLKIFKHLFIFERESVSRGGAERGDTYSEAGSRP